MPRDGILVVDDNVANLKLARVLLEGCGYQVRTAIDAEDAQRVLTEFSPRLILMDIQLPGMDGLEFTRLLKLDSATQHVAVVALTAYAMKGDEERALAAGCDAYISKPIDVEELPKAIERLLQARPR
jgi:two-component system, cell cycle response regulator DivK